MKQVYDFLCRLKENNNREWFNANKEEYLQIREIFNGFVTSLIERMKVWDNRIRESAPTVSECTYRIYRDTRFTKDKSPYKSHMAAYICRGGKKSPYAGYYFHLEPVAKGEEGNFLGESLLYAGLYRPESKIVKSLREEIYINGNSLLEAVAAAKGFVYNGEYLARVPHGYSDIKEEWSGLIRQKDFGLYLPLNSVRLFAGNDRLAEYVDRRFKSCRRYNELINNAVDYALEEC